MSKQTKVEEVYEDEYEEVETEIVKKRSFFVALSFLAAIVAVVLFVIPFWQDTLLLFEKIGENIGKLELLLPVGCALAVLIGVILSFVALIKASKPAAVFSWLFYTATAVAIFFYMQQFGGGIIEAFTGAQLFPIIAMVCAVAAVIFSFIGMIGTGTKEVEVEYEYEEVEEDEEEETAAVAPKGPQPVVNPPAYVRPVFPQPYPQTVVQPVPQPVPQPMPYPQPVVQPIVQPMPYYQPMPYQAAPNVYINIAPNGAVTTGAPAAQPMAQPTPVAQPVAPAMPAPAPVQKNTYVAAARPAPVVNKVVEEEEYYEEEVEEIVEETPVKKSNPLFTVFAILATLASVGLFVFAFLQSIAGLFNDLFGNLITPDLLLPAGMAVTALAGVIFATISLIKQNKGVATVAWLLITVSAGVIFTYVQLVAGGIVETITSVQIFPIIAMACAVVAVLLSFIAIFQIGNVQKVVEEPYEEELNVAEDTVGYDYYEEEPVPVQTVKKRSVFSVLAILATLAAVGLLVFSFITPIMTVLGDFMGNVTSLDLLLPAGVAVAALLGIIFAIASLASANKGAAVGSWLFITVSAVALFVYIQLVQGGIVETITNVQILPIIAMVCAVLAFIFAFIAMIQTSKKTVEVTEEVAEETYAEEEGYEEEPVAALPAESAATVSEPAPAPVASAAPVSADAEDEEEEEETDAFLRTLSPAQKREFSKVFLQGKAPSFLPAYQVDGNNNRFFDSVFVFLGKSREVISEDMLAKMYDFMMENK